MLGKLREDFRHGLHSLRVYRVSYAALVFEAGSDYGSVRNGQHVPGVGFGDTAAYQYETAGNLSASGCQVCGGRGVPRGRPGYDQAVGHASGAGLPSHHAKIGLT